MRVDTEAEAGRILSSCGLGPWDVASALEIAASYLGRRAVLEVAPTEVWGLGEATADGVIYVRELLHPHVRDFVILHEVAEIWIARAGIHCGDWLAKERACDAIAAALLAPINPFRAALDDYGADFEALASDFGTSQTSMALRFGEVTSHPTRVERPGLTRVRGAPYSWERPTRRIELTDAPDRRVLLAAA